MVQYSESVNRTFAAISDPNRRAILERLGRGEASITDLANRLGMSLTGIKKHVQVLEDAGLVATEKVGRVRICRLGSRRLDEESAWLEKYRAMVDARFDRLVRFLEETKDDELWRESERHDNRSAQGESDDPERP